MKLITKIHFERDNTRIQTKFRTLAALTGIDYSAKDAPEIKPFRRIAGNSASASDIARALEFAACLAQANLRDADTKVCPFPALAGANVKATWRQDLRATALHALTLCQTLQEDLADVLVHAETAKPIPLDPALTERVRALVAGVGVDLDTPIEDQ